MIGFFMAKWLMMTTWSRAVVVVSPQPWVEGVVWSAPMERSTFCTAGASPTLVHSSVVASLSDSVIIGSMSDFSVAVRSRPSRWAWTMTVAITESLTTLAVM